MPRYKKKDKMISTLTNQICKIEDTKLKFPLTDKTLELGIVASKGRLQQVRILPYGENFTVEVVFDVPDSEKSIIRKKEENPNKPVHEAKRIMTMDLGTNVLAL